MEPYTDAELESYLDEAMDAQRAAEIEDAARKDGELLKLLAAIIRRRDAGVHSLGAIWRRYQIGVPKREEMGQFLLGILDDNHAQYIQFRLEVLKCPFTRALEKDLQEAQEQDAHVRSQKRCDSIYQSSAGMLKPKESKGDA